MSKIKLFCIICFAILSGNASFSQTIVGPTTGTVGQVVRYTFNTGVIYSNPLFTAGNGSATSLARTGTQYYIDVTWTFAGTGTVTFLNNYVMIATKSVTVTAAACTNPLLPTGLTFNVSSNVCGSKTVSYSGASPPANVTWYWQASPNGVDVSNSTTSRVMTIGGTYYVRAKANSGNCWSSGVASINVSVTPSPAEPTPPMVVGNTCGVKILVKNGTPSDANVSWYWQGTTLNGQDYTSAIATSATYTTTAVPGTTTYYISAKNNVTGCWSNSIPVTATVIPVPDAPSVPVSSTNTCGPVTLSRDAPPSGFTYYWQGTNSSGEDVSATASSTNYAVSVSGTYYLRSRNDAALCWGPASSLPVTINTIPAAPSQPTVSTNTCGVKTLSKNGSPDAGVSWYWQGTNGGGKDYTSATATSPTYTAANIGTTAYFLLARNNNSDCWSTPYPTVVTVDNPNPANANAVQYCEWETMALTTTGYLSSLKWYNTSNVLLYSGVNYIPTNLNIGNYSYNVKNVSANGCESAASAVVSLTVKNNCDDQLNWSESIVYANTNNTAGTQKVISSSKVYTDAFGKELQTQVKSAATNQVFASQPVFDSYGKQTLSTLAAPINSSTFQYRHRFVTNNSGVKYAATDFDKPIVSGAAGEVNNPNAVGNNGVGTLGWYYSTANNLEPQTPITSFPYSRSWTEDGPNPITSKSAGPDALYKMGSGHEIKSEKLKIAVGELDHYFKTRPFLLPSFNPYSPNLLSTVTVSSTQQFYPNQNVTFALSPGYITITSNQTGGTPGVYPINGYITVTPGQTYTYRVKGYRSNTSTSNVNLYVTSWNGAGILWPGALLPLGSANEGWVSSDFTVPAGVTAIQVGLLWNVATAGHSFSISAMELKSVTPTSVIGYKIIETDPDGKRTAMFVDANGLTLATALVTSVSPTYTYDYWNYSYYNESGQLLASVAPNGINTTAPAALPKFLTTYKYDHLGRLIETTSPDEGTDQFVFSLDGKVRFSQNQEQRNASPKRFSYTNYDYLGRLIEAGEYTMSGAGYYVFEIASASAPVGNSVLAIADNVGFTGVTKKLDATRCTEHSYIDYDIQSADLPPGDLQGHTAQNNVLGQIAKTQNGMATTWYSYDEYGQLEWSKQSIAGLGYKTVDYTYDYVGNVTDIGYQKGQPEAFYHHYKYDDDQRLIEVRTSKDGNVNGTNTILHATYKYYLHGPLKRVELASSSCKQGVDYVYTITGALKGINSNDTGTDPGLDGISGVNATNPKDFFGETLHYHDNDYVGAAYNPGSVTLNSTTYPNQYGGNVRAISYNNTTEKNIGGTTGNARHIYGYQYDAVNQLTNAKWGSISGSTPSFVDDQLEGVSGYDKNGNITGLVRKGKSQIPDVPVPPTTANYNYIYEANTNKVDKINHNSAQIVDYTYNTIGQMTKQDEGASKIFNVKYNAYGLTSEVRDYANNLLQTYAYDDRGDLVQKVLYNGGSPSKTTYYVQDASGNALAIYEQLNANPVQLIEVPIYGAGRVAVHKPLASSYIYEISDHQGNVRAVCSLSNRVDTYTATMESELSEEPPFKNIANTRVPFGAANNTPNRSTPIVVTGDQVVKLNSAKPVGPTINLAVSPGDKIDLDVWAYYEAGNGYSSAIDPTTMLNFIALAFGGVPGVAGEAGKIYSTVQSGFLGRIGNTTSSTLPGAYMQYVLYDKNFNYITSGWQGVTVNGNLAKEHLIAPQILIEQPGYIFVCLYNRSNSINATYFDDLTVKVTQGPIVAGSDYYPFGLAMDGKEINDEPYRNGYQGQFSEEDETTGWNQFDLRMYDARFGRWTSADPEGQFASPYIGMGNSPHMSVDPNGGWNTPAAVATGFISGAIIAGVIAHENGASMRTTAGWSLVGGVIGGVLGGVLNNLGDYPEIEPAEMVEGGSDSFTTVTVAIKNGGGDGAGRRLGGHVTVRLNGVIYGFTSAYKENGSKKNIVGITKDTWRADGIFPQPAPMSRGTSRYDIKITDKQSEFILAEIYELEQNTPKYGVFGTRCTSAAARILRAGKVIGKSSIFYQESPFQFRKYMDKNFKKDKVYGTEKKKKKKESKRKKKR